MDFAQSKKATQSSSAPLLFLLLIETPTPYKEHTSSNFSSSDSAFRGE